MYVYIPSGPNVYTVGFYTPDGIWQPETSDLTKSDAAKRTAWLNGASTPMPEFTQEPANTVLGAGAIDNYKIIAALEKIKIVDLHCETKVHNALLGNWVVGGKAVKAETLLEMLHLTVTDFQGKPKCGAGTIRKIKELAAMYGLVLHESGEPSVTFETISKFIGKGGLNFNMLEARSGIKIRA